MEIIINDYKDWQNSKEKIMICQYEISDYA